MFGLIQLLANQREAVMGGIAAVGGKHHTGAIAAELRLLQLAAVFAQAKAAIGHTAWAITPKLPKFGCKELCQLRALQLQQMVHIAAAAIEAGIAVEARAGEIG